MRVIVFFDLPTETATDRREYRMFRKFLIKSGFIMVQNSVYSKLALNQTVAEAVMSHVRQHKPPKGLVQMISITEKQYQRMEYVLGDKKSIIVDDDKRLVIL